MALQAAIFLGGAAVPELAEASCIEIDEGLGETTSYRIRYPVAIVDDDLPVLSDGRLGVGSELAIAVDVGGKTHCLVKGPVRGQQITLKSNGAGSFVDVVGGDVSLRMDREDRAAIWSDTTDGDAVSSIVGKYDCKPNVEATRGSRSEDKHTLVQRGTDLGFVRKLARRQGHLFWITSDENLEDTAHFRRAPLGGDPVATLTINVDHPTVGELEIDWDAERPASVAAAQLDLKDKGDLTGDADASPLPSLGADAFKNIVEGSQKAHLGPAVDEAGELQARAEAVLIEAGFFLRARGATTADSLGAVLRAHTVVALQGAGKRHSGKYLCAGVHHRIDKDGHFMRFELWRNGWGV